MTNSKLTVAAVFFLICHNAIMYLNISACRLILYPRCSRNLPLIIFMSFTIYLWKMLSQKSAAHFFSLLKFPLPFPNNPLHTITVSPYKSVVGSHTSRIFLTMSPVAVQKLQMFLKIITDATHEMNFDINICIMIYPKNSDGPAV